jgi:drug/metabolite transporter (DMT)-like permease
MSAAAGIAGSLRKSPLRGLLYMLVSVFFLSVMDASAKWLIGAYPPAEIILLGRLPALMFAIGLALANGGLSTLRTRRLGLQMVRGLFGAATLICFFLSLRLLPLADTVAITFVAPLFMSAMSVLLLGERVDSRRWAAIGVGFIGVLVIVQPSGTGFGSGAILALVSAFNYALFSILSRRLSDTEPSHSQLFWATMVLIVGSAIAAPFQWSSPAGADLPAFAIFAFVGTLGQFLLIQALRYAEVSLVAPLEYTALIWATLFGFLFWDQLPTLTVLAGAAIIAASSLYIIQRETRIARRLDRPGRVPQLPLDST